MLQYYVNFSSKVLKDAKVLNSIVSSVAITAALPSRVCQSYLHRANKNLAIANSSRVSCAHAQYADGINSNPVTLKSKLRVTQGHWKQNHWIDHTRLRGVIWRWILSWSWNVGQRSFKITKSGTIRKFAYGFLFIFHSNYGRIFSHFGDIQRRKMA